MHDVQAVAEIADAQRIGEAPPALQLDRAQ
jgi:hypothetical protein